MEEPSPWRALSVLATAGITFVVATAGGALLGYFLDRWLGSSHWFTFIGMGIGIAAGFREFFRMIKAAERGAKDER